MEGEYPLHPHTEAHLSHGEGGGSALAVAGDHHALEHLDPLPAAFHHTHVDLDGVAGAELGEVVAHMRALEHL